LVGLAPADGDRQALGRLLEVLDLSATSSDRWNAPAKPSNRTARLRRLRSDEEQLDTIECESAEAALAVLLIGGQDIAMIFADVRLPGAMDGIDLAWEVKLRWPLLPMVLTSGHPRERERVRELPPGVAFLPKPWQPFNVLVVAEEALAYAQGNRS